VRSVVSTVALTSNLTPELLEVGARQATDAGVQLSWQTADAEAMPSW